MRKITDEQLKFLRALGRWQGVASLQDLGPQTQQKENNARRQCKRQGLVTFQGGYWRLTDSGRALLQAPEKEAAAS